MNRPFSVTVRQNEERENRKAERHEAKKMALATSALDALMCTGYTSTAMRGIAAFCGMSTSNLSYYFIDKVELITWCVRLYKMEFIRRIRRVADALPSQDIVEKLAGELARSVIEDRAKNRLWYDIRNQAMFDPSFLPIVTEIESSLVETLSGVLRAAGMQVPFSGGLGYAMLDGVYRFPHPADNAGFGIRRGR